MDEAPMSQQKNTTVLHVLDWLRIGVEDVQSSNFPVQEHSYPGHASEILLLLTVVGFAPCRQSRLFVFRQESGLVRRRRNDKICAYTEDNSHETFNEENPTRISGLQRLLSR
jgi:hypothetical protein